MRLHDSDIFGEEYKGCVFYTSDDLNANPSLETFKEVKKDFFNDNVVGDKTRYWVFREDRIYISTDPSWRGDTMRYYSYDDETALSIELGERIIAEAKVLCIPEFNPAYNEIKRYGKSSIAAANREKFMQEVNDLEYSVHVNNDRMDAINARLSELKSNHLWWLSFSSIREILKLRSERSKIFYQNAKFSNRITLLTSKIGF